MHGAERIQMLRERRPLKHCPPGLGFDNQKVQRTGDRRIGQFAVKHGLHHVEAGLSRYLSGRRDTRPRPGFDLRQHFPFAREPAFELLARLIVGWLFKLSCVRQSVSPVVLLDLVSDGCIVID